MKDLNINKNFAFATCVFTFYFILVLDIFKIIPSHIKTTNKLCDIYAENEYTTFYINDEISLLNTEKGT